MSTIALPSNILYRGDTFDEDLKQCTKYNSAIYDLVLDIAQQLVNQVLGTENVPHTGPEKTHVKK